MRRFAEEVWSVFPDWQPEVEDARVVGEETLVTKVRGAGRGVGSGAELDMTAWQVVRFREEKVIAIHGYPTEAEALEAAGVGDVAGERGGGDVAVRRRATPGLRAALRVVGRRPRLGHVRVRPARPGEGLSRARRPAEFWRAWLPAWETLEFETPVAEDHGDHVIVEVEQRNRGRGSEVKVDFHYFQAFTVRDGKVKASYMAQTRAGALKAVGLSE